MPRYRLLAVVVVLLGLGGSVPAEEVVHFKNGGALPIVTHKIEGEMIHVDLGDNAFMAFPLAVVDRVEEAGKNVMIGRSTVGGTNVIRARPDPTGSFPVRASAPSMREENLRYGNDDEKNYDPAIDVVNGVAVYRPVAGSGNPSKADTGVTGHARVRLNKGTPGALRGATQVGVHQVIGGRVPKGRQAGSAPVITGIEFNGRSGPPPQSGAEGAEAGDSQSD